MSDASASLSIVASEMIERTAILSEIEEATPLRPAAGARPPGQPSDEGALLRRLRQGDEQAFAELVDRYQGSLIRVAMAHVPDRSIAEEVVQETWLAVLEGLERFEERSSLKTWLFRILTNKAKTRGVRESRHVCFSPLGASEDEGDEPTVDPMRFRTEGHWVDYWAQYPQPWDEDTPERILLSKEGTRHLEQAIEALPPRLRQVLVLRDVEGLDSKEVCGMLGLSEGNQRVLLHRARARIRTALEAYLAGSERSA